MNLALHSFNFTTARRNRRLLRVSLQKLIYQAYEGIILINEANTRYLSIDT